MFSNLLTWIQQLLLEVVEFAIDVCLGFLTNLGGVAGFIKIVPLAAKIYTYLQTIGLTFVVIIAAWALIQFFTTPSTSESPLRIGILVIVSVACIYAGNHVLVEVANLFQNAFDKIAAMDAVDVGYGTNGFIGGLEAAVTAGAGLAIPGAGTVLAVGGAALALIEIIYALCVWFAIWKLIRACIERYLHICFIIYTSPLAWPTMISRNTDQIFTKWITMYIGECVSYLVSVIGIKLALSAFTMGATLGGAGAAGNPILSIVIGYGICHVTYSVDSWLKTIGIGVTRTSDGGFVMSSPIGQVLKTFTNHITRNATRAVWEASGMSYKLPAAMGMAMHNQNLTDYADRIRSDLSGRVDQANFNRVRESFAANYRTSGGENLSRDQNSNLFAQNATVPVQTSHLNRDKSLRQSVDRDARNLYNGNASVGNIMSQLGRSNASSISGQHGRALAVESFAQRVAQNPSDDVYKGLQANAAQHIASMASPRTGVDGKPMPSFVQSAMRGYQARLNDAWQISDNKNRDSALRELGVNDVVKFNPGDSTHVSQALENYLQPGPGEHRAPGDVLPLLSTQDQKDLTQGAASYGVNGENALREMMKFETQNNPDAPFTEADYGEWAKGATAYSNVFDAHDAAVAGADGSTGVFKLDVPQDGAEQVSLQNGGFGYNVTLEDGQEPMSFLLHEPDINGNVLTSVDSQQDNSWRQPPDIDSRGQDYVSEPRFETPSVEPRDSAPAFEMPSIEPQTATPGTDMGSMPVDSAQPATEPVDFGGFYNDRTPDIVIPDVNISPMEEPGQYPLYEPRGYNGEPNHDDFFELGGFTPAEAFDDYSSENRRWDDARTSNVPDHSTPEVYVVEPQMPGPPSYPTPSESSARNPDLHPAYSEPTHQSPELSPEPTIRLDPGIPPLEPRYQPTREARAPSRPNAASKKNLGKSQKGQNESHTSDGHS